MQQNKIQKVQHVTVTRVKGSNTPVRSEEQKRRDFGTMY